MRALITGITGFAGGHLAEYLLEEGQEVWGCSRHGRWPEDLAHLTDTVALRACDFADASASAALLDEAKPEMIFHLAAMANPADCRRDPQAAWRVNVEGTRHLYETILQKKPSVRVLYVSTSHVYGPPAPEDLPLKETSPWRGNDDPYSATKREADHLSSAYAAERKLNVVTVRPFHHVGPRRPGHYAIAGWAEQIAAIESGKHEPILRVGNLQTRRDYTDVRDVVRGYWASLQKGEPGEVFNLGSGVSRSGADILQQLLAFSEVPVEVETDPARLRDNDPTEIVADASRLRRRTGWQPLIPFENTLRDTLDYWRRKYGVDS